jgi:hypothetical protein
MALLAGPFSFEAAAAARHAKPNRRIQKMAETKTGALPMPKFGGTR